MDGATKRMYVLLMRSRSLPSKLIWMFTHEKYTHSSIGFSEDCMQLYSFARKYENLPLPGSFTSEKIDRGFMGKYPDAPCALYCFDVPADIFDRTYEEVIGMYKERKRYKYNYLGLILCGLGIEKTRKDKRFCSEFVSQTLDKTGVVHIDKPYSLFRPVDFPKLKELNLVYEGTIGGLREKVLINIS